MLRVKIRASNVATGAGLTGLTNASTGLSISTIADNEAAATAYTVAGSTIETITTLGTFAAPTATKCRFKEVDSTKHPGIYEIQIADARFAVSAAKSLLISIIGASNAAECDVCIPLVDLDPYGTTIEALALSQEAIRDNMLTDKTGFKLASDGLDSIATTAPAGVASNFREMMVQLWRRFFKKVVISTTDVKTYADDGTTVLTTQPRTETSTTQTQGAAT